MATTLRALRASSRHFSTTRITRDGFSDLAAITSPTTSSAFEASAPKATPTVRGYLPGVIAPKTDPILDLFTKLLMKHGLKTKAEKQMSDILTLLHGATNQPPLPLIHQAVHLAAPSVRVESFKRGAKIIVVPKALNERQRAHSGIKWIMRAAERGKRQGTTHAQKIVKELLAVLEGQSEVFKKVEEVHKMATLNRSNVQR